MSTPPQDARPHPAATSPFEAIRVLLKQARPSEALPLAEQWVRSHPQDVQAWNQLGHVLMTLTGRVDEAEQAFRSAWTISPGNGQAAMGLAGIHLGRMEVDLALPLLWQTLRHDGHHVRLRLAAAHRLSQALVQRGRIEEARTALAQAEALAANAESAPGWLAPLSWRLSPCWWTPVQGTSLRLRRPQGDDAAWLKACFAEDAFASTVNRSYAARIRGMTAAQVAQQLAAQLNQSPVDLGAQMFVIERVGGDRLGIASFVTIDSDSRRAEFIIGFAGEPPHGVVVFETGMLLAEFAFTRACFHKVTASLYSDNPRLADLKTLLIKLGFESEGLQRDHVRLANGRYVDIHLLGGLRPEVLANPAMARYGRRFLNREWSTDRQGQQPTSFSANRP